MAILFEKRCTRIHTDRCIISISSNSEKTKIMVRNAIKQYNCKHFGWIGFNYVFYIICRQLLYRLISRLIADQEKIECLYGLCLVLSQLLPVGSRTVTKFQHKFCSSLDKMKSRVLENFNLASPYNKY